MMKQTEQHLLELIVNSVAKEKGDFTGTSELVCKLLLKHFNATCVSVISLRNKALEQKVVACLSPVVAISDAIKQLRHDNFASESYFEEIRRYRHIASSISATDKRLSCFSDYYKQTGIESNLDVAIRINGHIEGLLCIEFDHQVELSIPNIEFACQFADQLALTLATRYAYDNNERLTLFHSATEQAKHVLMLINLKTQIIEYVNPAHEKMTGLAREIVQDNELITLDFFRGKRELANELTEKLIAGETIQGEAELERVDNTKYWVQYQANRFVTEQGNYYALVSCINVSEQRRHKDELENLAWNCTLTGLHNRLHFTQQLDRASNGILFLIDLMGFKRFNDTSGHEQGDALLTEVARRLKHFALSNNAIDVARVGSDEFAVLLPDLESTEILEEVVFKLYQKLAVPSVIGREKVDPKAAIAVVDVAAVASQFSPLSCADIALQYAKKKAMLNFQIFNDDLLATFKNNADIERDLMSAIRGRQFELYYQPLMDLKNHKYIGAEALIRWHHPKKGILYPGAFIEIAEQSGMINAIGDWVLEAACKQLNLWQRKDVDIVMHVNVAARQFFSGNLFEQVWNLVTRYRIKPQSLILEITETELMGDIRHATRLCQELADLGVGLAIDDFGTGYSSMRYLKQFPITKLKIDRSFISDLTTSHESREIVSAIIAMAKALNISLTAEGVETKEQEIFLEDSSCHHAQGYLYSPAIRENEFSKFIFEQNTAVH
ncbi:EAL domain-containing protein [Shewanella sp. 1_MG-2023]|uniref:sensor domain-containing phosphodiesterase n=1 Tax=unclassified Shewanella TaxID=196818 RepID=UPI001E4475C4|nr:MULTISPECIES: EAL domain-containing protein [unclassified Shewanella]MCC4831727.1 EAL domain-containing protein [Shewanella sp. 10N.7]MDO6612923.1 EAL domain-containing protein [Shewanella sp. 7_MG-2023]MDO6772547.1 EAL domain-containing protein [Shewanella sp. 2_MG-2023]MDO6795249.1 EAL domain-containing protein [Shewanella sp. 1_MG-2023]